MIELSKIRVSVFNNAMGKTPEDRYLGEVLDGIRGKKYTAQITDLRQLLAKDRKQYDAEKKKLPAFTISGTAKSRKEPGQHSGLLQVDLDKLGGRLEELRQRLKTDPYVVFGFLSPSGEGLKLGVAIDPDRHEESFVAVAEYFHTNYQATIDPKCKDRLRLCFVSHDSALWITSSAVPLPIPNDRDNPLLNANSSEFYILNPCVPASLDDCTPASLASPASSTPSTPSTPSTSQDDREDAILANIEARTNAHNALGAKSPKLLALYKTMVDQRYQAKPGNRNEFITEAVPFLYRAVAPRVLLIFVATFYDAHQVIFKDSRAQHMKEAEAMLKSVEATFLTSLSEREGKVYHGLDTQEQEAFRICRDLALRPAPQYGPMTFFMSCNDLGGRLGVHPVQAQRILRQLTTLEILVLLEKGNRRAPGVKSKAGVYRWQFSSKQAKALTQ